MKSTRASMKKTKVPVMKARMIKDFLSHLSQAVSEKRASALLHSMAASKDILFWTSADNYFEINV